MVVRFLLCVLLAGVTSAQDCPLGWPDAPAFDASNHAALSGSYRLVVVLDSASAEPPSQGSVWLWPVTVPPREYTSDGRPIFRQHPGPLGGVVEGRLLLGVLATLFAGLTDFTSDSDSLRTAWRELSRPVHPLADWFQTGYDTHSLSSSGRDAGRIVLGWRPGGIDSGPTTYLTVERKGPKGFGGTFNEHLFRGLGRGRFCAYREP